MSLRGSACCTTVQEPCTAPVHAVDSAGTNKLRSVLEDTLALQEVHNRRVRGTRTTRRSEAMLREDARDRAAEQLAGAFLNIP